LNFKLYAFVYDLNKGGSTSTDLRIAILDAFNEASIAMPFRQTDAMPQNMDWFREAGAEYVSRSHNGSGSGNGKAYGTPQVSPQTANAICLPCDRPQWANQSCSAEPLLDEP